MGAVTIVAIVIGSALAGAITMAFIAGSVLREAEADLAREREAHARVARLWAAVPSQIRSVVRAQVAEAIDGLTIDGATITVLRDHRKGGAKP